MFTGFSLTRKASKLKHQEKDGKSLDTQKIRQEVSRKKWQERIYDRQSSGLTIAAWCEARGISEYSYYYWLRKLREEALLTQGSPSGTKMTGSFCELTFPAKEAATPKSVLATAGKKESSHLSVSLHLPGLTLEISPSSNPQEIRVARAVLESLCC